ncbi:MAG: Fic family protein [Bacteroides sp.]|nr:Fic family protein [Bacteroides sp.]
MLHYSQDYLDNFIVRYGYDSNAIEGNKLTFEQSKEIILHEKIVNNSDKVRAISVFDCYEAANQKDAFYTMLDFVKYDRQMSVDIILSLHYQLTKNTLSTAGHFKTSDNYILGTDFKTASVFDTPFKIKEWVNNTNYLLANSENDDIFIENLIKSHILFERIHPFDDGNGRTGRELINFELAKRELPFLDIKLTDRNDYMGFENKQDYQSLTKLAQERMKEEKEIYLKSQTIDN